MASHCRSCGKPIIWALTKKRKRMPVDMGTTSAGTLYLRQIGDPWNPVYELADDVQPIAIPDDVTGPHTSHFATCPNADQHRKPRK